MAGQHLRLEPVGRDRRRSQDHSAARLGTPGWSAVVSGCRGGGFVLGGSATVSSLRPATTGPPVNDASEVVALAGVSKRYCRTRGVRGVLAELLGYDPPRVFWALRDVSLAASRGERLGVVGANGAGKTTLLRLLSGVISPTRGERRVAGTALALSEMQACLHRELTGRENIPLLAALAGLSRREIESRFDEVLAFASLPPGVVDTPVKNYSSGMAARLAISVAATVGADLILVDEGLAGGDAEFRRQCFDRLDALAARGAAVVLATHEVAELRSHSDRCVYLKDGRVVLSGAPDEVLAEYQRGQGTQVFFEAYGASSPPAFVLDLRLDSSGPAERVWSAPPTPWSSSCAMRRTSASMASFLVSKSSLPTGHLSTSSVRHKALALGTWLPAGAGRLYVWTASAWRRVCMERELGPACDRAAVCSSATPGLG